MGIKRRRSEQALALSYEICPSETPSTQAENSLASFLHDVQNSAEDGPPTKRRRQTDNLNEETITLEPVRPSVCLADVTLTLVSVWVQLLDIILVY